ncbi:MAG: glycosyltransferase family 39 protein [Planctomycetota bacterium]
MNPLSDSPPGTRRLLLIFLLTALVLRIFAAVYVGRQVAAQNAETEKRLPFLFPDSNNMHSIAMNLAAGKGHVDEKGRYAWRMPGYQAFLAFLYSLGLRSAGAVRLVQAVLGTANVLLLYFAAKRHFGNRAGLVAAFAGAVDPVFVYFSALVLVETLATTMVLLVCLSQRLLQERLGLFRAVLAGAVLGAAVLVKETLSALILFYLLYWFLHGLFWARERNLARGALVLACLVLGWALVLAPWSLRNHARLGTYSPFSTTGGHALYESNSDLADGGPNNNRIVFPPGSDALGEVERDRLLKREAASWILAHPGRFARLAVRKFLRTWSPVPNYAEARSVPKMAASFLSYTPVMLLALYALWRLRREWALAWLPVVPVIYTALLHMVFMGSLRYRVPVMVCLMILAGKGFDLLLGHGRVERSAPVSGS